jgi:glycine hydroxymethyltransferase
MNQVCATAITLGKALQPEFKDYCKQVLANAKTLAATLTEGGAALVTGGTDNHMMVVDCVQGFGITGKVAEEALDAVSITCNKQVIPDDPNPPLRPSGIRLGTPAATTRGFGAEEMRKLGGWMIDTLRHHDDASVRERVKEEVEDLCSAFPVPGIQ